MRAFRLLWVLWFFMVSPAQAEETRVALVIGNSAYTNSPLRNPVYDAQDVARKLRGLGFEVVERTNMTTKQIGSTLAQFRSKLTPGAVAVVFYAGHGVQIKGENYLPAVDADINTEEEVPNQSLSMRQVMDVLETAKTQLNLVFLDACRNNPYARSFRSGDRGLARVSAPSGTLISYATRPGSVAADGKGKNGLYTSKLLLQLDSHEQIEQALKHVIVEVKKESDGKQEPWMEGSIEGDFCFAGCVENSHVIATPAAPLIKTEAQIEDEFWEAIKNSAELANFEEYLRAYPRGRYLKLAKLKITQIKKNPTHIASENTTSRIAPAPRITASIQEPDMIAIPAGSFTMGCKENWGSNCGIDEKPPHVVNVNTFQLGQYEVTQALWQAVMGSNPSGFANCGETCPVERVSWEDIQAFIQKLNALTGKRYRLPSEAEWEYACRAGGEVTYCGGNKVDLVAWHEKNSDAKTHAVGEKQANAFGLYDMSGNVWEWVQDCNGSYQDAPSNGAARSGCDASSRRMLRGGSWYYEAKFARAAFRVSNSATIRDKGIGFRLAITSP
ncbi:MAG: SUMF1/EgtB/PvdO family nonheme iron enzyme [Gallionella sp.]|nr:SUMF1/EgtB/PvdO family nonheme iron enzyme [Gallionella sp.]MDD4959407.1 SUMF1/EgtB/PvdO family nonheme iron enzyme [Gallionella sp.]